MLPVVSPVETLSAPAKPLVKSSNPTQSSQKWLQLQGVFNQFHPLLYYYIHLYMYIYIALYSQVIPSSSILAPCFIWLVVSTPLKNMSSSVGMMTFPINMESHKKKSCSKPPTSQKRGYKLIWYTKQKYQGIYLSPAKGIYQWQPMAIPGHPLDWSWSIPKALRSRWLRSAAIQVCAAATLHAPGLVASQKDKVKSIGIAMDLEKPEISDRHKSEIPYIYIHIYIYTYVYIYIYIYTYIYTDIYYIILYYILYILYIYDHHHHISWYQNHWS